MKRGCIILCLLVLLLLVLLASLVTPLPFPSPFLGADADDALLLTSTSPEGTYILTAYCIMEGATVADSIRVYRDIGPLTVCIYNGYREQTVRIEWQSDRVVVINGIVLDLSRGESYDWRR